MNARLIDRHAMRPKLLQVCNVGRIVGGTAACAWSAARALPDIEHHVRFLSAPDTETRNACSACAISCDSRLSAAEVKALRPDAVLLHNTSASRIVGRWSVPTLLYLHSAITDPARADATVGCSHWLARSMGLPEMPVLWQGVPKPKLESQPSRRRCPERLVVGRICTPTPRKWPPEVVAFYELLAARASMCEWEFIGCPAYLEPPLRSACRGRATFHPASWAARSRLWNWDALLYSNPSLPESFGRTVAEGMRAGCVPIVDRLGGFIEQVPVGCGFLCDRIDDFAAALESLADPIRRREYSERAMRHADTWFSLGRFGTDLRAWLEDCAQR